MSEAHAIEKHPVHEELGGYEGSKLAMWLFLSTELLFFGILFAGFFLFQGVYPNEFRLAHLSLDKVLGAINTFFLITSSLTIALSIDAIQRGMRNRAAWMLAFTIIFALAFMVVKYFEYEGKFAVGIMPGDVSQVKIDGQYTAIPAEWNGAPINENGIALFFAFYFVMTAIHGLHIVIGIGLLGWLLIKMIRGAYSHWYYTPVENGALYWHLVDLVWIFLFPLLYLI